MRITSLARPAALIALVLSLVSCGQLGSPVAVLDLNRVVTDSGLLTQVNSRLAASRRQLQQQLRQVQSQLADQVNKAKDDLGDKPSAEKKAEFQKLVQEANQRFAQARRKANEILATRRVRLLAWMRQQVRPVARRVADAKGMKVVLLSGNALVFDHDTSLDITDQVLAELGKNGVPSLGQPQAARPAQPQPAPAQPAAPAAEPKPAAGK